MVQRRAALPLKVRRHGDEGGQGHDAGAADAGQHRVPRLVQGWQARFRQRLEWLVRRWLPFGQRPAMHRDEAGTESVQAAEVLVAGALIDAPLAAELGFAGHHRQAVGRCAAVAAALANRCIDEGAHRRVRHQPPLAPPATLGGAGLGMDHHRHAWPGPQLPLHVVQIAAIVDAPYRGVLQSAPPDLRVVADHGNALDALGVQLPHQGADREASVNGLSAGHGHRFVVEDLERDVHPGRQGGADRQRAGVEVGAVAQVLEYVRGVAERRLANPGRAFAAHLGVGVGRPVRHPSGHVVAANAAQRVAAFRHPGRAVVRASGAEVGRAQGCGAGPGQGALLGIEEVQPGLDGLGVVKASQAAGDGPGHQRGCQFAAARHQIPALLVEFADHPGAARHGMVVELAGELVLDDRTLLLHHQDVLQSRGERMGDGRLQRPTHAYLEHAQAQSAGGGGINAQILQGLQNVQIGLAGGDDAKSGFGAVHDDAVQPVGADERLGGGQLVPAEPEFLLRSLVGPAGVQSASRPRKVLRQAGAHPTGVDAGHHGGVRRFGDGLKPHPAAAVAGQGPAVDAEVQQLLDVGRIEHGHGRADEDVFRLMGHGRGLAGMVVARHRQHPAMPGGAAGVGVAEGVNAAIHPRPLAVPHAEHAVEFGFGMQFDLLAPPDRSGRQFLVQTWAEPDVVAFQPGFGPPQGLIQPGQGRAAIAGNQPRRVEARQKIALMLQDGQPHQGLNARQISVGCRQGVLVIKRDGPQRG